MNPKEKAESLISKFMWPQRVFKEIAQIKVAKECALVSVKESLDYVPKKKYDDWTHEKYENVNYTYLINVKNELEKINI